MKNKNFFAVFGKPVVEFAILVAMEHFIIEQLQRMTPKAWDFYDSDKVVGPSKMTRLVFCSP
jgi:hypothetical protein